MTAPTIKKPFIWSVPGRLDISGCIVTIDAMGTQKKIARTIIEKDCDYVLALKENHKTLHDEVVLFFDKMEEMKKQGYEFDETICVDGGHGRVETRRSVVTSDIDWLEDKKNWNGFKSIGMIESTCEMNGSLSHKTYSVGPARSGIRLCVSIGFMVWGQHKPLS